MQRGCLHCADAVEQRLPVELQNNIRRQVFAAFHAGKDYHTANRKYLVGQSATARHRGQRRSEGGDQSGLSRMTQMA
jgi:hypothetical protein